MRPPSLPIKFHLIYSTLWFFSTRYIFYSIYFIIKYNIELIFANTSIIEYWFFSDVEYFFPRIAPPVALFKKNNTKNIDDTSFLI